MQVQSASGNERCFEETGSHGSKVKADWIKDGAGEGLEAAGNQFILF